MSPREHFTIPGGGEGRLWLNGRENVILQLREKDAEDWQNATTWGFATLQDWKVFAKACLRFDERVSAA